MLLAVLQIGGRGSTGSFCAERTTARPSTSEPKLDFADARRRSPGLGHRGHELDSTADCRFFLGYEAPQRHQ